MARMRVFVSSTFYDLKHIRASLENFIESFGFEAVLFERGDIPFQPDHALDQSCYQEAEGADIFVLIIGGRYGSRASEQSPDKTGNQESYKSITRKEFETAQEKDIPSYILVESNVMAEYHTYRRNRENKNINYAHVDNIEVFIFLESILDKKRNNPVSTFDRSTQIESWLREQWSGLFRELLKSRSEQKQLAALGTQLSEMKSINETLKTYIEKILGKALPEESEKLVEKENSRISSLRETAIAKEHSFYQFLLKESKPSATPEDVLEFIKSPENVSDIVKFKSKGKINDSAIDFLLRCISPQERYNSVRVDLGIPPIIFDSGSILNFVKEESK